MYGGLTKHLEQCNGSPRNELTAIVSLIRKVSGLDNSLQLTTKPLIKISRNGYLRNKLGTKFNEEQMEWLRMIKEYVVGSFHIEKEDFDLNPFNAQGGLGKMWQLFGVHGQKKLLMN